LLGVGGRPPTQVEDRDQRIDTLRPPRLRGQDRRAEADFLLYVHIAPVAHLGAADLDRPDPGLDCAMRPMTMPHDAVAAIRQFQILPHGDKRIGFGDQHLSEHSAGAFTCKFTQRIVDGLRLTECDDSGISRHGVSLLSGGFGRLDTRLDTPPSINRRHPDSGLARRAMALSISHWPKRSLVPPARSLVPPAPER